MSTSRKKPKGLGMGLEALLGPRMAEQPLTAVLVAPADGAASSQALRSASPAAVNDSTADASQPPFSLSLDQLQPGKYQPRTHMDEGSLYELAQSIKNQGVMQPILVRPIGEGRYEVIAGERRMRAAHIAGLSEVPVLVKDVADEHAAAMSLIENIQREDLNPLEEAQGLQRLTDEFGLTHEQAAQAVGRSRSTASNLLRLLQLTEPVQQMLMAGDIEMGHARALLPLKAAHQIQTATAIATKKLSVREAERLVSRELNAENAEPLTRASPQNQSTRELERIEQILSDALTAHVQIRIKKRTSRGEQGEVAIAFSSLEELNSVLDKLGLETQ
jgi:ParB family transcriptional regulator, chromosome partitioning protein